MNNDGAPDLPRWLVALWPIVWPFLGGLGGAIISLGLSRNETLPATRKAFNVLSGTIIAIFLGPLVVRWALGQAARADSEMVGAIYCLVGLCGTSVIERIVRKAQRWVDTSGGPLGKEPE
jgi:hypothetical protein